MLETITSKEYRNKTKRKNDDPEFRIQCVIADYLDNHQEKPLWCASAGGMRTSIGTAVKMKRMGYKKGILDIFIYEPHEFYVPNPGEPDNGYWFKQYVLAIEIKAPGGKASAEQRKWKKELLLRGYRAEICPSRFKTEDQCIEWAKSVIDDYLRGGK